MSRKLSLLIAWGCSFLLVAVPVAALLLLFFLESFAKLAQDNLHIPIQWWTVTNSQWYSVWLVTAAYVSIGLVGLYFLRRSFRNLADGEFLT